MSRSERQYRFRMRQFGWRDELKFLIRGISGGFLFGIPLIYTMEVWWIGSYTEPPVKLALLAVTFGVIFLLSRTESFGDDPSERFSQTFRKSIKSLAIGIICTTFILILLREIRIETSLNEALGKIIYEGMPFSIGVALSKVLLNDTDDDRFEDKADLNENQYSAGALRSEDLYSATLADIGATFIGAFFIAFSIAPTDEISMLTSATSPPFLLAIIAASLAISYAIVFASGFTTQDKRNSQRGLFQNPIDETVMSYLVSLFASILMLLFFQRLNFSDPWTWWLEQALILGLPATVGGAAGRLAV
ncbi:MAG TPA: TIGR02587 family membrane protein [Oscillatoriales cyanobacterium M59_W2019_021]|nr:TIGR02587 family membrane protein [Oscillatoriales cyanobacterium M4454_W2019_049]HIK50809.1 TIGR02587 family membrane protein [Oscillatoriales cyanobacterium M59_W2019_021]